MLQNTFKLNLRTLNFQKFIEGHTPRPPSIAMHADCALHNTSQLESPNFNIIVRFRNPFRKVWLLACRICIYCFMQNSFCFVYLLQKL